MEQKKLKKAALIHNPEAGKEEYSKEHLLELIESYGFSCEYLSTKEEGYKKLKPDYDFIIVAGGDGTVRKVVKIMLESKKLREIPLAVLSLGTANNISHTLGLRGKPESVIQNWHHATLKSIDVGVVTTAKSEDFFIEGMGFGLFPSLMREMKKGSKAKELSPPKQVQYANQLFRELIDSYEPKFARIETDGMVVSGKFYLVETMNIRSIGPNLLLAPYANPGDGEFEVVLIAEGDKDKLMSFDKSIKDKTLDERPFFSVIKTRKLKMTIHTDYVHVDDQLIEVEDSYEVNIEMKKGALQVLV